MKKLFSLTSALCLLTCSASAVYLQPFLYYGRDQFGFPVTNAVTISSWPPTNNIVGNNTNLIISVNHTFIPDVNGFFSNNIALGNYRLQIDGFDAGVPFSISSNALPVVISQTANVPITTFMNFTLAQFSDAGSIAYRGVTEFVSNSPPKVVQAIGFQPATNSATGILTPLNFQPATNSAVGILTPLNFQPATNTALGILTPLNFQPATNSAVGILTPLNFQPATNSFTGVVTPLGYTPHTNDGNIGWTNLNSGVANIATNGFLIWICYKTNGDPGNAFTNAPQGSLLSTTNGYLGRLSNLVWHAIAL